MKRFFRRNSKNYVDEIKLQGITSLKRLIQGDKTTQLQNLISKLDDKIVKLKPDVQRLRDRPGINKETLKRELTALEYKLTDNSGLQEELAKIKSVDKTQLESLISKLDEKIAKQKLDVQNIRKKYHTGYR
ncbi:hypothetical protein LOTGIDRAFT_160111 [Lottia gigantea]|uniref:Uncharacterized protein n=1 Tax=Lottia gigantea TaxID=225164 RepID=V4C3K7_LOTGI|nr:hypothetical protein LOTGIDRAFT_160111 [Lottia gigantea]ESO96124.1 hypothetical protein LOTGIDRAFT_160111 [Lottia gigantea]